MPLINQDILKAFYGKNSFHTGDTVPDGQTAAIMQAENIVFQNTLIPIPENVSNAIPTLQFIACSIYAWLTSGMQNSLNPEELSRLKKLFDDAMQALNRIRSGDMKLYDSNGIIVETGFTKSHSYHVNNCRTHRV